MGCNGVYDVPGCANVELGRLKEPVWLENVDVGRLKVPPGVTIVGFRGAGVPTDHGGTCGLFVAGRIIDGREVSFTGCIETSAAAIPETVAIKNANCRWVNSLPLIQKNILSGPRSVLRNPVL